MLCNYLWLHELMPYAFLGVATYTAVLRQAVADLVVLISSRASVQGQA